MYVCPTSAQRCFRYGYRRRKDNTFYLGNHFVWLAKYGFKVQFNIIKYKYVKEIHFCVIFLAKKFVLSMIVCIFAPSVLAKPLIKAQPTTNREQCQTYLNIAEVRRRKRFLEAQIVRGVFY